MDLRLELRRTIKLVVPSPKGDLVSVVLLSGTSVPGSGFFRPSRDWFAEMICGRDGTGPLGKHKLLRLSPFVKYPSDH